MSSHVELSGNRWDDLYFTPNHPDADDWRAEIAAEMAAGFPRAVAPYQPTGALPATDVRLPELETTR